MNLRSMTGSVLLMAAAIVAVVLAPADAATPGNVLWEARGDIRSIPLSVMVAPDGGTVFAGDELFGVVAYEAATGALLWRGGSQSGNDRISHAWALSPDGHTLYATGQTPTPNGSSFATVAYDATSGGRIWAAHHRRRGQNVAESVATSPDGEIVFATGTSKSKRFVTVAYRASTGEPLWASSSWNRRIGAHAYGLTVDPAGERIFVTGTVGTDLLTVAYATNDGDELWSRRYGSARPAFDEGLPLITFDASTSLVFVTASTWPKRNGNDDRFLTIAYDAEAGRTVWSRSYDGSPGSSDVPAVIAVDPSNSQIVVTGRSDEDIATVAYDASSGEIIWETRFNVEGPFGEPNDLVIESSGSHLFVLGTGWGAGTDEWDDFLLLAYDKTSGALSWNKRWGGAGELREQATAIALDPSGTRIYVTGSSADDEGSYDHVVVAFSAV